MSAHYHLPLEAWAIGGGSLSSLAIALALRHALCTKAQSGPRIWLSERRKSLSRNLVFVRCQVSAEQVQAFQIALTLVSLFLLSMEPVWAVALGAMTAVPHLLLSRARAARTFAIERQVEGWLSSLSRALEAAPSLGEALHVSASSCDSPMKEELSLVLSEMHLGRPLDRALSAWSERVGSRILTLSLAILQVGRHTGGRLPQVLKSGAESLREMERLEGVLRTKTAEGRAQAWVISVVPVPLYLAVQASDPDYFLPLETTATGHLFLAVAAALWVAAIFAARKILAVQI